MFIYYRLLRAHTCHDGQVIGGKDEDPGTIPICVRVEVITDPAKVMGEVIESYIIFIRK